MNEIRNCEFRFKCPKEWNGLKPTDNHDQRYCSACNQIVYFCHTANELMAAIQADHCVAVRVAHAKDEGIQVGMPAPEYNPRG